MPKQLFVLVALAFFGCGGTQRPVTYVPQPVWPEIARITSSYDSLADFCEIPHVAPLTKQEIDDCWAKLVRAFYARAAERYTWADWTAIANHCNAYPAECVDLRDAEQVIAASHVAREQQANAAAYEQARAEQRRAMGQAISQGAQAFGNSMQRTNCTSSVLGSSVYTRCY